MSQAVTQKVSEAAGTEAAGTEAGVTEAGVTPVEEAAAVKGAAARVGEDARTVEGAKMGTEEISLAAGRAWAVWNQAEATSNPPEMTTAVITSLTSAPATAVRGHARCRRYVGAAGMANIITSLVDGTLGTK